jgi:LysM repeat protein
MRDTPNTTSLLIEYGFIDNPNDVVKLQNNLLDYVEAVVRAVANYIGVQYVSSGGEVLDKDTYVVRKGDTLYSIARMFNVSVNELKELNNLTTNNIFIGQVLRIPSNDVDNDNYDDTGNTYTVVLGDNLYNIANRYGVSVVDIINLNNLSNTILTPGQVLLIPGKTSNYTTYTVKKGDTLYSIASSYGVSVDDIKSLNNLTNNNLSVGQELLIPTDKTITETNYEVYTIVPGDTLYDIANRYGVSVDDIKRLNNLDSNFLIVGQRLQIPLKEVTSSNFIYTVTRGDTLYGIASNFGLNVIELINLNNLDSTNLLIGQELLIPQK